ncbi:tubulin-like doman-containing protein [Caulobacter soli]|uniref:tubulin-like doman-containing protein n=1 Tax=Caulobacter soli TaxID=2708539 RepID=UPI0013EBBA52|nr:tubulin-like doman-containing protein [Caulobacter soli]
MNHLLIGLGGTGGRVLKAFRKAVYEGHRDEAPPNVTLDYLFVDSDPESFRDKGDWTVLGKSLFLPNRCHFPISRGDLKSVLDDINQHPNVAPWLGDRAAWGDILAGLKEDSAGGQKRRLGRFLFALRAKAFVAAVRAAVGDMQTRSKTPDITFHVFTGFAGGTGSGSVIDVVAQLRKEYPEIGRHKIILYGYIPDLSPPQNWLAGGNYFANGYAAIQELNALLAGAWKPFDVVTGERMNLPTEVWTDCTYVFSDDNDRGYRASIQTELMDILADFVYHKIVLASRTNWGALKRAEAFENVAATPETDGASRKGQRAVQFLSFGMRRIAFPEQRIREYLTFDFATQAYRQLQFNNWQADSGFLEQPRPRADAEFAADRKQMEDWRLTDDQLRLSRPIIETENSKRWLRFDEEWAAWETNLVSRSHTGDRTSWLGELRKLYQTAWDQGYRSSGVQQFFQVAERDQKNYADEIRNRVQRTLFDQWQGGERSLNEVGRVVTAVIHQLEARAPVLEKSGVDLDALDQDLTRQLSELQVRWSKIALGLLGAHKRELQNAGLLLRQQMSARTNLAGARFARALINQVIARLQELKAQIDSAEALIDAAGRRALEVAQARSGQDQDGTTTDGYVTTVEDAKAVAATRRRLVLDEGEQRTHTTAVRQAVIAALGQEPDFRGLNRRLGEVDVRDVIVATCARNVASSHARLVREDSDRVIGVSIIEKLVHLWGDNPAKLRREVEDIVRSAGRFVVFDDTEKNKKQTAAARAIEAYAIMMPEPKEHGEFVKALKTAFRDACNAASVEFVPVEGDRQNEISLIGIVYLFPLRYMRLLKQLKGKYEERVAQSPPGRAALEIHIEDGGKLPSLFLKDSKSTAEEVRRRLLLAYGAGLILEVGSGKDRRLVIPRKDDLGLDLEPIELGRSLPDAADQLTEERSAALAGELERRLSAADTSTAREAVLKVVGVIRTDRNDDPSDKVVLAWSQAAREAIAILEGKASL